MGLVDTGSPGDCALLQMQPERQLAALCSVLETKYRKKQFDDVDTQCIHLNTHASSFTNVMLRTQAVQETDWATEEQVACPVEDHPYETLNVFEKSTFIFFLVKH